MTVTPAIAGNSYAASLSITQSTTQHNGARRPSIIDVAMQMPDDNAATAPTGAGKTGRALDITV